MDQKGHPAGEGFGRRPEPLREYRTEDKGNGIFAIQAPPVGFRQYLVLGTERALLVDTGFGVGSLRTAVEKLTALPVTVVNTHGHPDHCGGNSEFAEVYMNAEDLGVFHEKCTLEARSEEASHFGPVAAELGILPTPADPMPLADGQAFDLGGRTLTVFFTPGHTRGCVSLKDSLTGAVFSGDMVNNMGASAVEPAAATVREYVASLQRILAAEPAVLYTGHMSGVVEPAFLNSVIAAGVRILSGEKGEAGRTRMGYERLCVRCDGASFEYAADKNS